MLYFNNGYLLPGCGIGFGTVLRLGNLTGPAPIAISLYLFNGKVFGFE